MSDHTKTPWIVKASAEHDGGLYLGNECENAALVPGYTDHPGNIATAAFIAKAVNNYDALMQALEKIAAMDPKGIRADDLGRAARIAAEAIRQVLTEHRG